MFTDFKSVLNVLRWRQCNQSLNMNSSPVNFGIFFFLRLDVRHLPMSMTPHRNLLVKGVCIHLPLGFTMVSNQMYLKMRVSSECLLLVCPLMVFGLLTGSMARFRGAPRCDHLSTRRVFSTEVSTLLTGPSTSRRHLFSAHDHGRLRSDHSYLRRPDCTLSRLRAEEYDRPVTQSMATP